MLKKFFSIGATKYASKWLVLLIDLALVSISFILAYFIRFDVSFSFNKMLMLLQLPTVVGVSLLVFLITGSYKGIIRHTGTRDAFNILGATFLIAFVSIVAVFVLRITNPDFSYNIPVSVLIIHYFVSTFILIISRFLLKAIYESLRNRLEEYINVLIYGAGDSGIITLGVINSDAAMKYRVVGFIDDDIKKSGKKIDQLKIKHSTDITQDFLYKNEIQEVVISIQNISPKELLRITDSLINLNVKVKMIPPAEKWIASGLKMSQIKDVNIDDLLDRPQINFRNQIVEKEVADKIILITGAAGSIGSEIVKQLSTYRVKSLILIDSSESPLYDVQQELIREGFNNFYAVVASIRDYNRMEKIFQKYKPQIIFHAAAYKHVPLMEVNHYEAILTNVSGTKIVADLACRYESERFVMISTDKAVNPTNIMGATKRITELYVSCLSNSKSKTKFTTTRFGNVLGSNGSVIPLFKKQIEKGGPLTVTHKEITRFFMTIPEACSLVLEAATMGKGGEIYIFDMGQPVKIFEIAKKMIKLSGYKYPDEIDIEITGLRPGEKLFEELLADGENTIETYHNKILIAKVRNFNSRDIKAKIEKLCQENQVNSASLSVRLMKQIVPEFKSNNSDFEIFDKEIISN